MMADKLFSVGHAGDSAAILMNRNLAQIGQVGSVWFLKKPNLK